MKFFSQNIIRTCDVVANKQGGPDSVRFGYASHMEWFEPVRFFGSDGSPEERGSSVFLYSFKGENTVAVSVPGNGSCDSGSRFGSGSSGSGSVPEPP